MEDGVILAGVLLPSGTELVPGLKGLFEGVGLDVWVVCVFCALEGGVSTPGGNLEGTVPALVLRMLELRDGTSMEAADRSGKVSSPGDSGIVSRSGVERPLAVGGPHP